VDLKNALFAEKRAVSEGLAALPAVADILSYGGC
jgi:hypothetical protein